MASELFKLIFAALDNQNGLQDDYIPPGTGNWMLMAPEQPQRRQPPQQPPQRAPQPKRRRRRPQPSPEQFNEYANLLRNMMGNDNGQEIHPFVVSGSNLPQEPSSDQAIMEKLDIILQRLDRIEETMARSSAGKVDQESQKLGAISRLFQAMEIIGVDVNHDQIQRTIQMVQNLSLPNTDALEKVFSLLSQSVQNHQGKSQESDIRDIFNFRGQEGRGDTGEVSEFNEKLLDAHVLYPEISDYNTGSPSSQTMDEINPFAESGYTGEVLTEGSTSSSSSERKSDTRCSSSSLERDGTVEDVEY